MRRMPAVTARSHPVRGGESRSRGPRPAGRRCLVTTLVAALLLWGATGARAQTAFFGATIDGPNPAITALGNVTLARDGTGAVSFLSAVGGVPHVFASLETAGSWSAPVQVDAGLPGGASQPLVAAASGGRVAAVFISAGTLYGAVHNPGTPGFGTPQALAASASNPALAISDPGTAYASFTAPAGGVSAVYVARLDRASRGWQVMTQPLNLAASDSAAFNAATRSSIAVGTDGQALVAWGESESDGHTHVIARRVSPAGPSVAPQDLNLPALSGLAGGDADSPSVSLGDASDFGWVAFRESFTQGTAQISRTIARHQYGSLFDPPEPLISGFGNKGSTVIDPLTVPTADGADDPDVSIDGSGDGLATIETTASHQVFADPLSDPYFTGPTRADSAVNQIAPEPVAAVGGTDPQGGLAWLQSTGPTDPPSVHVRAYDGSVLGPESVVSQSALGAVGTGPGALAAAADRYGDTFVAYLQGAPTGTRIVVGGLAQPPQPFGLLPAPRTTQRNPVISWSASSDALGLAGYKVEIDYAVVGTTRATHLTLKTALKPGKHTVRVVAVNRFGVSTASPLATLVVAGKTGTTGSPGHP